MDVKQCLLAITLITCIYTGLGKSLNVSIEYKTGIKCDNASIPLTGEPLTLLCQYGVPMEDVHKIEIIKTWNAIPKAVFYYNQDDNDNSTPIRGPLQGRASYAFINDSLELNIASVKLSDCGTYQCFVYNSEDGDGITKLDNIREPPTEQYLNSMLDLHKKHIQEGLREASVGGFGNVTLSDVVIPGSKYLPPECVPVTVTWRLEGTNTRQMYNDTCQITSLEKTVCTFSIRENQLMPGGNYDVTVYLQQYHQKSETYQFSLIYKHDVDTSEGNNTKTSAKPEQRNMVMIGSIIMSFIIVPLVCVPAFYFWKRKTRMRRNRRNGAAEETHTFPETGAADETQTFLETELVMIEKDRPHIDEARHYIVSINDLQLNDANSHKILELPNAAYKMDYVNGNIWIPRCHQGKITVVNEVGATIRDISIESPYPVAVQQVSQTEVMLATGSGLYVLTEEGDLKYNIRDGKFCDVSYYKNQAVAIELHSKQAFVLEVEDGKWTACKPFYINCSTESSTVLAGPNSIYINDYNGKLMEYDWTGEPMKETNIPNYCYICGMDKNCSLLFCSPHGQEWKLKTLSESGNWTNYKLSLSNLYDTLYIESSVYVLHEKGCKISKLIEL